MLINPIIIVFEPGERQDLILAIKSVAMTNKTLPIHKLRQALESIERLGEPTP